MMRLARQIYRVDAFTHPLTMPPYYQMLVEEAADDGEGKIESHLAEGLDSAFAAAHNAGWDGEIDEEPYSSCFRHQVNSRWVRLDVPSYGKARDCRLSNPLAVVLMRLNVADPS